MLRTISSRAVRRQRRLPRRMASPAGIGASTSLPTTSSSLPCHWACTDRIDHHGGLGSSRRLHSLSSGHCSASLPTSLIGNDATGPQMPHPLHHHTQQLDQLPRHPVHHIQRRTKVFVSRHNNTLNLTPQSITSYVCSHLPHLSPHSTHPASGDFRITNSHVVMKECPFCPKPTNGKSDNFYKLYIAMPGGAYFCHRCGAKGSWYDFKSELGGNNVEIVGPGGAAASGGSAQYHAGWNGGGGQGGGVSQPWNWNTSNNHGMGYMSTKQLHNHNHGGPNNNTGGGKQQKVEPLPMPAKKVNSLYTARLFDPSNSASHNPKEHAALEYLTRTRGLHRAVLQKYGVGCGSYNFPDKNATSGMSYVSSMCVTFPWLMRCGEVAEQEELRGAEFVWRTEEEENSAKDNERAKENERAKSRSDVNNGRGSSTGGVASTGTRTKKPSEMSPLERFHHRRAKKDLAKEAAAREQTKVEGTEASSAPVIGGIEPQPTEDDAEALHGPFIPRRLKVRSIEQKSWQRLDPPGGGFGLFGWHTVPSSATEIVVTEGEFDAMAVYQATGRPAVSLPNGCRSLPVEVLVLLEKFDTVYLWMDNDGPGQEGAEMFAKKLGVERCLVVRPSGKKGWKGNVGANTLNGTNGEEVDGEDQPVLEVGESNKHIDDILGPPQPPKDANEALLTGWDIGELLEEASELPHERILKFADLRDQVIHEIVNPEKYQGAPVPSLPGFTSLIKGYRRGELTVLTGPTGSGKTTFLGQASLDLAEQGINVLWGSFEIKNTRLMHKLLQQYMKDVLPVGLADRDLSEEEKRQKLLALEALADKFETLPMHFMKFHGGSDVDDVLDAMEYAAYVHDVEHIILDNMQFMISRQSSGGKSSSYDKFDMQDIAIEKFRKFATDYNVHVQLVVHPRKEDEGAKLGISSFYGSAKATQEADTVIILQSDGKRKFVDVRKNRFDGTLGHVPLYFERKSGRYSETEVNIAPRRTVVPNGVSAVNGARKQLAGARASAASASTSVYQDIRGQHPIS